MTQRIIHATSPTGQPLCGRVLSRNAELTLRGQFSMLTEASQTATGFAPGQSPTRERACRYCQRALGLLPPLTRSAGKFTNEELLDDAAEFEGMENGWDEE